MKILKYNENAQTQQKELDDFIELFVKRFELDDNLGNMGSYDCVFENKKIILQFKFVIVDEDELKTIGEICKYIKKFDNYTMFFTPVVYKDAGETFKMIICKIRISLLGYKNIYDDLEIWKDSKKYNL